MRRWTSGLALTWALFALLVLTLDAQSLWWDESISLHLTTLSWPEIVANRAANIHPPLYFFALKLGAALAGRTPFAARYLSALAATLLPAAAYAFTRRRVSERAGRASALLVALAPPFFIYGQEARGYAFLPLLMLALLAQVWPAKRQEARGKRQEARGKNPQPSALSPQSSVLNPQSSVLNPQSSVLSPQSSLLTPHSLLLALTQVAFILTHYAGVVAAGWANLALLLRCLRARDRRLWRTWLISVGLTALLAAPWGLAVLVAGAAGFREEAGLSNALAAPLPADYFLRLIGIFHAVGLPQALSDPTLYRPALLTGVLLLASLGFWVLGSASSVLSPQHSAFSIQHSALSTQHSALTPHSSLLTPHSYLLLSWLLPLLAAPAIWWLSPQAHPRYLLPFVLPGWLLIAALTVQRGVPRWLRGGLLAATLTLSVLGLRAYLTVPTYARSDMRAVASIVRTAATPGDIVLLPYTDYSLTYYDTGAARPVVLTSPDDDAALAALLAREGQPGHQVFAMDYGRGALDPRGQARLLLEWGGYPVARYKVPGAILQQYVLQAAPQIADAGRVSLSACVAGASPCLAGATWQLHPEGGAALPVILQWQGGPAPARYAVGLRLYATNGALVGGVDGLLLDAQQRPTELWDDTFVTTYHLLPLPPGLAPRAYRLEVGVYATDAPDRPLPLTAPDRPSVSALALGDVVPAVAPALATSRYGLSAGPAGPTATWGDLTLTGAALDRGMAYAGQSVFVTLAWQVGGALPSELPALALRQGERVLASASALADLPPLPEGRPVLEHLALSIPPDAADGPAMVVLVTAAQEVALGEVTLSIGEHVFSAPEMTYPLEVRAGDVATLLGYDLAPGEVRAGELLTLTLVWRAEEGASARDLTVFTHLLGADGSIVAQHDGYPAEWTRPTGGWLPGEIIVDRHILAWQQPYSGPATLRVGLYEAATGARVIWEHGADAQTLVSVAVDGRR